MNTRIFKSMSYGVYLVSTLDEGRPTGCIANCVMQITVTPPTIAVSLSHDNYTNQCMERCQMFGCSILSEQSSHRMIGTFGFRSGEDVDKFEGIDYETAAGVPVVKDSCGYVVCKIVSKLETATHTIFLGEVIEAETYEGEQKPMTYDWYRRVRKGKSPKSAPTYLQEGNISFGKRTTDF